MFIQTETAQQWKQWIIAIHNDMGRSKTYYTQWKKPKNTYYIILFFKSVESTN
jgi:hypothetical protein